MIYNEQDKNTRKTWLLMTLFLVFIILFTWVLAQVYNNSFILYFGVIFSIGSNFLSYWYSDKIVLSMSGAIPADRENYFDLYTVVENLSITAGLPKPKVYIINDSAPNAFATGRDKEHAVVCVTSGLLNILNRTELEGVIAHELSHIGNRDILLSTIVVVLVGFVSIASDWFLRSGFRRSDDRESNSGLWLILGIVFAILSPIVTNLIHLAISRKREYLADASGALLTRYPEGLASALEKIGGYSGGLKTASNATAHLFISNPFGNVTKGIGNLFQTHPPIEERVKILRGMDL
ncbi:MAG: M48 family metallopeptidase [bacterium]